MSSTHIAHTELHVSLVHGTWPGLPRTAPAIHAWYVTVHPNPHPTSTRFKGRNNHRSCQCSVPRLTRQITAVLVYWTLLSGIAPLTVTLPLETSQSTQSTQFFSSFPLLHLAIHFCTSSFPLLHFLLLLLPSKSSQLLNRNFTASPQVFNAFAQPIFHSALGGRQCPPCLTDCG